MILHDHFLAGVGRVACTVDRVTTDGAAGRVGLTVSTMASVSADAEGPVLLVCVHFDWTRSAAIVEEAAGLSSDIYGFQPAHIGLAATAG